MREITDKYLQLATRLERTKQFAFLDLRDKFGNYCILGLMCELSNLGSWHDKAYYLKNSSVSSSSLLHSKVAEYYELPSVNPYFILTELADQALQLEIKSIVKSSRPYVYLAQLSDAIALNNVPHGGSILAKIIRSGVDFK